jgi:hypothetical protein
VATKKQITRIDDSLAVWIEQGAIHLKVIEKHNDPIELSAAAGKELAHVLLQMCQEIEASE